MMRFVTGSWKTVMAMIASPPLTHSAVAKLVTVEDSVKESPQIAEPQSEPHLSAFDDTHRNVHDSRVPNLPDAPVDTSRQDARTFYSSLGLLDSYYSTCEMAMTGLSSSPPLSSTGTAGNIENLTGGNQLQVPCKNVNSTKVMATETETEEKMEMGSGMEMVLSWMRLPKRPV